MNLGLIHAADGFVMAMVVILVLSLGMVASLGIAIYRNGKRRQNEVEKLLEELRRQEEEEDAEQTHPAPPTGAEPREPWEKDVDWWKK